MTIEDDSVLAQKIIKAIRNVLGNSPVALHEPSFRGNEWAYVKECIDTSFVSSVGKYVDRFESDLASYTGAKHAVAVVNGTAALHIALILAGVKNNEEVLVPALTFIGTVNAISYCNAIPHFVDSEESTLGIDSAKLREYLHAQTYQFGGRCVNRQTGRVINAIVPMHTFGHPVDLDGLLTVAHDYNITIVEDAAEALGSYYQGQHTGTFGKLGILSFNGNKAITTGGGGAILTDDPLLARHAKHITTTAKLPHLWRYQHDEIGYNYRMPNINAALGCAQLEQISQFLVGKRRLFEAYKVALNSIPGLYLFGEPKESQSNYWLQTIVLEESHSMVRDTILQTTNDIGIMTRPAWDLMPSLLPFGECPRMDLSCATSLSSRIINIPSSAHLLFEKK